MRKYKNLTRATEPDGEGRRISPHLFFIQSLVVVKHIITALVLRQVRLFSLACAESPYDIYKQFARTGNVWEDYINMFIRASMASIRRAQNTTKWWLLLTLKPPVRGSNPGTGFLEM